MTLKASLEGWAAIYGQPDLNGDIVVEGAFERSLKRSGAAGVKLLYQHQPETLLGRWTRFESRREGLYAFGEILLVSETQNEAHAMAKAGVLDGLSIGYRTRRAVKTKDGRRITEAELWEVSLVTFPMAPKARVTLVGDPITSAPPPSNTQADVFANAIRDAASILSV